MGESGRHGAYQEMERKITELRCLSFTSKPIDDNRGLFLVSFPKYSIIWVLLQPDTGKEIGARINYGQ